MVGRVSLGLSCLVSFSILFVSSVSAQARAPEQCGLAEADAQYGPLAPGAVVTLQRHRLVRGDDNWDVQMDRFLGREARVSRLSGVDAQGCPGIRVDVDGGQWFWRVRDVGIGTGLQPLPENDFPQQCHQSDGAVQYGAATVGASVILGRHRPVDGEANWTEEMQQWVGSSAHIRAQAGVDASGCPIVHVDVDGGQWVWRVRDLRAGDGSGAIASATTYEPSVGVTTDHGRPPSSVGTGIFGSGGIPGPQECGLTADTVVWSPIAIGVQVVIGHHRPVNGDANWDPGMDSWVGQSGRVTQLAGVDEQGCPVVRIDLDQGSYYWRVRDMTVTPSATGAMVSGWTGLIPRDCGMTVPNFGSLTIGSRVILGAHSGWTGPDRHGRPTVDDTDWAPEMMQFVGSPASIVSFDAEPDPAGCPGVRVDIDDGNWFWRIRDMQPAP